MKRIIAILVFFTSISTCILGQNKTVVLKGRILNDDKRAVPYADIQNIKLNAGASANEHGDYIFKTTLPASIKISSIGYKTQQREIESNSQSDTLYLNFILETEIKQLQPAEVSTTYKPEVVNVSDNLIDFEIKDDMIWLLNRNGNQIEVLDTGANFIRRINLKYSIEKLYKTKHNFIYTLYKDSAFVYGKDYNYKSMPLAIFQSNNKFLEAYNPPYYYYKHLPASKSYVSYSYFNTSNKTEKNFYNFLSSNLRSNMELYRTILFCYASLKDLDKYPNMLEDIMNNKLPPDGGDSIIKRMNTSRMLMDTVSSWIRIIKDNVYIFNFSNDSIYVYNHDNIYSGKLPMSFDLHDNRCHKKDIIVDEERERCYFKYVLNGITHLEKIDLNSGMKINSESLKGFPFIEKIRISHGNAYFSYFDSNSGYFGERYIYKKRMN